MFSKATVIAFAAALGAVNASPLLRRQETGVPSLISSAVSGAVSSATGAVSGVSSAVSTATDAASSAVATATSDVSSAVASATSTGAAPGNDTGALGSERYPNYPCAPGYLLTYAQVNQTLEGVPVTQAGQAAGEWATSPLFPNVTNATGGTEPGATHTISVMGISINEVLVEAEANATSGYAAWAWNSSAPVTAGAVTLDTYQTVFKVYDPDFTTTGTIGNTTFVQIYTNACANDQAAAAPLLETLGSLELGLLGAALSNATAPAATTAAEPASSAAETATSAVESASSAATSAVESATSAVESASSAATSAVESATSAVSSAASGAAASATSVASAATSAAAALTSTSA